MAIWVLEFLYQPIFKKSKTDPAAGIAMGALAVLPSNKCGAHEIFHDWSIPPFTAVFVVPSVSRAFLWAFLWAFLKRLCGQNRPKVS